MRTKPVCKINFPNFLSRLPSFPPSSLSCSVSPRRPRTRSYAGSVFTLGPTEAVSPPSPPNPSPGFDPSPLLSSPLLSSPLRVLVFLHFCPRFPPLLPLTLRYTPLESRPAPPRATTPTLSPQKNPPRSHSHIINTICLSLVSSLLSATSPRDSPLRMSGRWRRGAEGLQQEVVFQIQICFLKWLVFCFFFLLFCPRLFVPNSACVHAALPFSRQRVNQTPWVVIL